MSGLDSEFNSINFGIEMNKCSKFLTCKNFRVKKIEENFRRFLDNFFSKSKKVKNLLITQKF